MSTYILSFQEIDRTRFSVAGGKGANLGELSGIKGIRVPEGFCVTTDAYKKITENNQELHSLLDELNHLKGEERKKIGEISANIRQVIEGTTIPKDITEEICRAVQRYCGRPAVGILRGTAGYLFEYYRKGSNPETYQQMLGFPVYGSCGDL